jgi:hypothetical protein
VTPEKYPVAVKSDLRSGVFILTVWGALCAVWLVGVSWATADALARQNWPDVGLGVLGFVLGLLVAVQTLVPLGYGVVDQFARSRGSQGPTMPPRLARLIQRLDEIAGDTASTRND